MSDLIGKICTYCVGCDRYVGKIVRTERNGKTIYVELDWNKGTRKACLCKDGEYKEKRRFRVLLDVNDPYVARDF